MLLSSSLALLRASAGHFGHLTPFEPIGKLTKKVVALARFAVAESLEHLTLPVIMTRRGCFTRQRRKTPIQ